jgi:tetratricopeptide (TPR) repeat protein
MLGMLLPVLGIVQVGGQALADRYTYLPTVGLSLALLVPLAAALPARAFRGGLVLALCAAGVLAARQVGYWRDTITLFQRALSVTGENHVAATNLGSALAEAGRLAEAEPVLLRAIELAPRDPRPATSWASLLALRGDLSGAREAFAGALRVAPAFVPALRGLTGTSAELGDVATALDAGERWVRAAPADAQAHYRLGLLREERGERGAALERYRAALAREPALLEAGLALAWLVATTPASPAEKQEALGWAVRAVSASGGRDADALDVLAAALAASGDFAGARATAERALQQGGEEGRARREEWLARYRAGASLAPPGEGQ